MLEEGKGRRGQGCFKPLQTLISLLCENSKKPTSRDCMDPVTLKKLWEKVQENE